MELKPIRTEEQYQQALEAASWYVDHEPVPGSPEGDRFEVLLMLIEAYESTVYGSVALTEFVGPIR
ncbi:hypothetical protein [Actimicrobium sp. CCI2.3]|uniref:hypothetical protein n=1 Tax=Actimicrobium sp. CCI2.3 TaxID=3048616 RepID=UPI002AB36245|nr:hypothetical protein [Actimicrobium sp. CCI2.3]MDY7576689.1 hypothetical protein [Actimicrobium sp. CCI2.3]MEB0023563.1 hypothetical protein [Actimicrobium sp. CCI2.3]